jgi:hypothetical protein
MTEAEWLACKDPHDLLDHLADRISDRKLRLFACARCRRVWHLLTDERSRRAVEAAELFADGRLSADELAAFRAEAGRVYLDAGFRADEAWTAWVRAVQNRWVSADLYTPEVEFRQAEFEYHVSWVAAWAAQPPGQIHWDEQASWICRGALRRREPASVAAVELPRFPFKDEPVALLRDILGNPFRPVTHRPEWLTWNGGTVLRLARTICEERAFDRMPILADALEEAGCTSGAVLVHCRRGEPGAPPGGPLHWPGCWVLDLVLSVA